MSETPSVTNANDDSSIDANPAAERLHDTGPTGRLEAGLLARGALGGALMGLANLVPGISGGTMLVAAGIYTRFVDAIADTTRLRLRPASLALLGVVVLSAVIAIGALAGVIAQGLSDFRWGMYSLFIGLTLGGAPLLVGMIRSTKGFGPPAVVGTTVGIAVMAGLVLLQAGDATAGGSSGGPVMLVVGGIAGASAMILPGVSGAYLLLLLGLYDTIINSIKTFVEAGRSADLNAAIGEMGVVVPVGIGVVLGVVVVSNLLRFLLHRYESATLGVLLGLLLAAPLGLYPFREGVPPRAGDTISGDVLTAETAAEIDPKDWPQRAFTPSGTQLASAAGLVVFGFSVTLGIARLGRERQRSSR
ncbi:MAG: DUF368 domain-containing protein [Planctomycetota bacterium]